MIRQLAHLCIHTDDLDATERFYTEGLGLEVHFTFFRNGERFGYYLACGGRTFVEVFAGKRAVPGNIDHLALEVEDMDGLLARVKAAGYGTGEKKMGADHSWQAWLEDPNGVRIELHEYTEESLQLRGGTCEVDW